jgi:hypothetical protein
MALDSANSVSETPTECASWQHVGSFPQQTFPMVSDVPTPQLIPLTVRSSVLNLRFLKLTGCVLNKQLQELQYMYVVKSAQMETDRLSSLNASKNDMMRVSVNLFYDQQHHALLACIEQSLKLLETKHIPKPTPEVKIRHSPTDKASTKAVFINNVAVRIMTNWYERNIEHPYPSYETAEVMANAGNVSVEQVKKWFANRRLRFNNTKHITDIAKRRKRCRTISQDDIFFTGAGSAD